MRPVVIIPARYRSTRFPGKPLVNILGKPMIIRVADVAAKAVGLDNVYIATDDSRIEKVVDDAGYKSIITSPSCLTGTDRVAEAAKKVDADIYINVQGDEPTILPEDINLVIDAKRVNPAYVINSYCDLDSLSSPESLTIPKVAINESGRLIYISRSVITANKNGYNQFDSIKRQVCIYAFSKFELEKFVAFGRKSTLEQVEDIEILRFFDLDIPIKMIRAHSVSAAVDVPEDVEIVENIIKSNSIYV